MRYALLLLLTGCAGPAANHVSDTYTVRVEAKGYGEINLDLALAHPQAVLMTYPVFGWSEWEGNNCTMHVPAPKDVKNPTEWEMKVWGHEALHCVYKDWH